jgi:hypothetical protein
VLVAAVLLWNGGWMIMTADAQSSLDLVFPCSESGGCPMCPVYSGSRL